MPNLLSVNQHDPLGHSKVYYHLMEIMLLQEAVPVPVAVGPAPSAAAASPAAGRPCSSVQSGRPAAALGGHSAGLSSSTTGAPSPLETQGCLERIRESITF